jgi:MoaA/NifB/PqqE/SkfB family radical SAM enzyme
MSEECFMGVLDKYGSSAIIHITGGEPSCVPWLYPLLRERGDDFRFHLNTNAFKRPPAESVKRLKVSLDSDNDAYWDNLVGVRGAWDRVVRNVQMASEQTNTSITYTLTQQNYQAAPRFAAFARRTFPNLYATFFSIYKGDDRRFVMDDLAASEFFENVRPALLDALDDESRALLLETLDEKRRLLQGVRFEQPKNLPCYLSMSERVIGPDGSESCCSHLYRDGIKLTTPSKTDRCAYGCNQRLVAFNKAVASKTPTPPKATS